MKSGQEEVEKSKSVVRTCMREESIFNKKKEECFILEDPSKFVDLSFFPLLFWS